MKITVCVRQASDGEINPFDACAYEAALSIPGAEITLLSMAPLKSREFLSGLTRLGAKQAVLLSDTAFAGADTLATAYTLSLAVKKLEPDLIICGRQTVDGDTGQVGPELAEMTGFKLITNVMELSADESGINCKTRSGESINTAYPALITIERINNLRLPSIRSKMSETVIWKAAELHADILRCGLVGSPTRVIKTFENEQDRRRCRFIDFSELEKVVKESLLKQRVSVKPSAAGEKLKNVWIMGGSPRDMAETVSDDITVIPLEMTDKLPEMIKQQKPIAVLWGSDNLSKSAAARTAARLKLGLCADCTVLETDGKELFMYRPAFSGSIIAKIRSETVPAMATVRTAEKGGAAVVIGAGMGARHSLDKIKKLSEKFSADTVATRLMVDNDYFPYENQVGLTGKTISPDVYIAVGISGAVHHIAGIKNSGTIIAVNRDKDAPIFKYADYGVVYEL